MGERMTFNELLDDLIKQASTEKSHYYTAKVLRMCKDLIIELEDDKADLALIAKEQWNAEYRERITELESREPLCRCADAVRCEYLKRIKELEAKLVEAVKAIIYGSKHADIDKEEQKGLISDLECDVHFWKTKAGKAQTKLDAVKETLNRFDASEIDDVDALCQISEPIGEQE